MKYLLPILLFVSCQKIQTIEVVAMPDFLSHTRANRMTIYENGQPTNAAWDFYQKKGNKGHLYRTVYLRPTARERNCIGDYTLYADRLVIDHRVAPEFKSPLPGVTEVFRPVRKEGDMTILQSGYRIIGVK